VQVRLQRQNVVSYLQGQIVNIPISPALDVNAMLHAKSTADPSFAIIVTQSGAQILVLVPHFSTHTITITNLSQVIPAVPEFPFAMLVLVISFTSSLVFYRLKQNRI